jgi:hypothetical protein
MTSSSSAAHAAAQRDAKVSGDVATRSTPWWIRISMPWRTRRLTVLSVVPSATSWSMVTMP